MFNLVSFQSCSARPQVADSRCPIDLVAGHKLLRKAWQLTEVGAVFVTLSPCERSTMVIGSKKVNYFVPTHLFIRFKWQSQVVTPNITFPLFSINILYC